MNASISTLRIDTLSTVKPNGIPSPAPVRTHSQMLVAVGVDRPQPERQLAARILAEAAEVAGVDRGGLVSPRGGALPGVG
ncbi:hypothetical protein AB0C12_18405 [Actinoplanes sp. NPDC048967]|uniref:hypothetical protein n=1 Tax=Actinoplanes sp. NPDC048967 TaxID=3155269 RepID=UPI0033DE4C9D